MAEAKKNILTQEGLKTLEDELQDLKVVKRKEVARRSKKRESRETYQRMLSTMLRKMSRGTLRQGSKN